MRPHLSQKTLTGGELNAAIARAVVHIHRVHVGRGPRRVRAFYRASTVVVILEDVMTKAERHLTGNGVDAPVLELKTAFQAMMHADLTSSIEELTGCKVVALMSADSIDPDMACEVFVLDRPVPEAAAPA